MKYQSINCPYCKTSIRFRDKSYHEQKLIVTNGSLDQIWAELTQKFAGYDSAHCSKCSKSVTACWIYEKVYFIETRPVILNVIPNLLKSYRHRKGNLETAWVWGAISGRVPVKGAQFSLNGAGLFRLGVGEIIIRGSNNQELKWTNVFRAKKVIRELENLATRGD